MRRDPTDLSLNQKILPYFTISIYLRLIFLSILRRVFYIIHENVAPVSTQNIAGLYWKLLSLSAVIYIQLIEASLSVSLPLYLRKGLRIYRVLKNRRFWNCVFLSYSSSGKFIMLMNNTIIKVLFNFENAQIYLDSLWLQKKTTSPDLCTLFPKMLVSKLRIAFVVLLLSSSKILGLSWYKTSFR